MTKRPEGCGGAPFPWEVVQFADPVNGGMFVVIPKDGSLWDVAKLKLGGVKLAVEHNTTHAKVEHSAFVRWWNEFKGQDPQRAGMLVIKPHPERHV